MLKDYYSYSQFYTYAHCGLKYKIKYIDGHETPTISPNLIFGDAIHRSLEHFHRSHAEDQANKLEVFEEFANHWNNLATDEIKWKTNKEKDNLYEMGIDMLNKYYDININGPKPLMIGVFDDNEEYHIIPAVEIPFEIKRNDKKPIKGIIDLITIDENGPIIIDHKTAGKMYNKFQIQNNIQLIVYSVAFSQMVSGGHVIGCENPSHSVGFNVLLKETKTKTGKITTIKRYISEDEILKFERVFDDMDKGINAEIYLPNYGQHCGYCDYRDICLDYNFKNLKKNEQ